MWSAKGGVVVIDAIQFLTESELAEVKKNQPPDMPKLEVARRNLANLQLAKEEPKPEPPPAEKPARLYAKF